MLTSHYDLGDATKPSPSNLRDWVISPYIATSFDRRLQESEMKSSIRRFVGRKQKRAGSKGWPGDVCLGARSHDYFLP